MNFTLTLKGQFFCFVVVIFLFTFSLPSSFLHTVITAVVVPMVCIFWVGWGGWVVVVLGGGVAS